MATATVIGFIGIGLALIIVLLILHQAGDAKTADAIGLVGVALIGAGVALYVGHNADENAAQIGEAAVENTRTVGINNILAQIERVQDSQQGIKPCSRYIVRQKIDKKFCKERIAQRAAAGS